MYFINRHFKVNLQGTLSAICFCQNWKKMAERVTSTPMGLLNQNITQTYLGGGGEKNCDRGERLLLLLFLIGRLKSEEEIKMRRGDKMLEKYENFV